MLREEEELFLESVIREYLQVPSPRLALPDSPSPAEVARRKLRALRELIVGKPSPEIVGKDVDGRPMKLSALPIGPVDARVWRHSVGQRARKG
jgi:hypothetical protein